MTFDKDDVRFSDLFPDYFPSDDWVRNYKAMKDTKLDITLGQFRLALSRGSITKAIEKVMEKNGDLDDNYTACLTEAFKRGLI